MNISALYELRDRLASCAVAGINLIGEDFRLKRAVEQMEPLAAASPAFQKIHIQAQKLLAPECEDRPSVLLDTLALVDAVLCTQGVTGVGEEFTDLNPIGGGVIKDIPHSILGPLIEALEGTGGGRQAIIMDAHKLHPQLFDDFRIQHALVEALGDGYSEIADTVQRWLSETGPWVIPLLKSGFEPKGKKGMARRVRILERLCGAEQNDFYLSLIGEADKDVRTAATMALRHCPSNAEELLHIYKTEKAGGPKQAAQIALGQMDTPEVADFWAKALDKKPIDVVRYLSLSTVPSLSNLVAQRLGGELDAILERGRAGEWEFSMDDYVRLASLMMMTPGKGTPAMCEVYRKVARERENLNRIIPDQKEKAKTTNPLDTTRFPTRGTQDSKKLGDVFPTLLVDALLLQKSETLMELAQELYRVYGPTWAAPAMAAAFLSWGDGNSVYKEFAPLLKKDSLIDRVLDRENVRIRGELLGVLGLVTWDEEGRPTLCNWYQREMDSTAYTNFTSVVPDYLYDRNVWVRWPIPGGFGQQWYDLLLTVKWKPESKVHLVRCHENLYYSRCWSDMDGLLENLLPGCDESRRAMLGKYFYGRAVMAKDNRKFYDALILCGWKDYRGLVCKYAQRNGANLWHIHASIDRLPLSNEEKAQEMEEICRMIEEKRIQVITWNMERARSWCKDLRGEL